MEVEVVEVEEGVTLDVEVVDAEEVVDEEVDEEEDEEDEELEVEAADEDDEVELELELELLAIEAGADTAWNKVILLGPPLKISFELKKRENLKTYQA